eukprot:TRINITY_DN4910_c0_g1_i1.p1 TRINITY_DN4910_c0_g1~~TRINITY_DN4910_c0_g1_i1.p1  ORF type:complete len:502 (-),score=114.96 TRINITY_DN4910_c0_g1_i1:409-1914(-)
MKTTRKDLVVCGFLLLALHAALVVTQPIVSLSDDSFDAAVLDKDLAIVKFYASWCPHSKALAPQFEEAASHFQGRIFFAEIDAAENTRVAETYKITAYPMIYVFRAGNYIEYHGARSIEKLTAFFERELLPAVTILNTVQGAAPFLSSDRVVVFGYFESAESQEYLDFAHVASGYRQEIRFAATFSPAVAEKYGFAVAPAVAMFKLFDEPRHDFDGEFNQQSLDAFINLYSIPLSDELVPEVYRFYIDSGFPLVLAFVDPTNESAKNDVTSMLVQLGAKYRGQLTFAWINAKTYSEFMHSMGLDTNYLPGILLQSFQPSARYLYDGEVSNSTLDQWITSYLDGELKAHARSEPLPERNDGFVTVVVGDNYHDIVYDTNADVFVEYYAPWCEHCQNLAPTWEDLGYVYRHIQSLTIAKMDATANDVIGLNIEAYPTLFFYPANAKDSPIEYEGDRTIQDLIHFVEQHASIPFDTSLFSDEETGGDAAAQEARGEEPSDEYQY